MRIYGDLCILYCKISFEVDPFLSTFNRNQKCFLILPCICIKDVCREVCQDICSAPIAYRPALLPADVGGVEVLDGQTLLLHVEAPQPLTCLLTASTLGLQHTPAGKTSRLLCDNTQIFTMFRAKYLALHLWLSASSLLFWVVEWYVFPPWWEYNIKNLSNKLKKHYLNKKTIETGLQWHREESKKMKK